MHLDRNAPTVVDHRNAVVLVNGNLDSRAKSRHSFIDGVVDNLVNEVVQPVGPGRPNVHRRTFPYRVEALENLDGSGVIRAQMNLFLARMVLRWAG
jgi:hypothetical protein